MAEKQNTEAPASGDASPATASAEPTEIRKGTAGVYHYLRNGPRRCVAQARVFKAEKDDQGELLTIDASIQGETRRFENVRRYDPTKPNRPGFAPAAEKAASQGEG